ncbi:MAG: DUF5067 domain-containing protein [Eggerthellaceae bacterium]|nr:DUF5067 domain-containing protein [Eggerthellaceae bacterium]
MEKKPTSGLAVASLVTGIIALVSSFVPLLNILSFPFVILAIVFGAVGIVVVRKGAKGGKGLGIAGLALGVVALIITLVMYGGAAASYDADSSTSGTPAQSQQAPADSGAGASTPDASAAQNESEPAAPYEVVIGEAALAEDYQGNSAVVVEYAFTNNSDEAISPMVAVHAKAFQNGVQLESAIGADGADANKSMSEIKPGASVSYSLAYVLEDASDVTVEVEELFDFSGTILAEKTLALS